MCTYLNLISMIRNLNIKQKSYMYLLKLNNARKNWAARGPARAFRARACFGPGRFELGPGFSRAGP